MNAAKLIDRLEQVKPTGHDRWLACCPAHKDKRPSLSVRQLDDGRVLVHDFGGCEVGAVLEALGLSMADLYPTRQGERRDFAPTRSRIPAADVLQMLSFEATVVMLAGFDIVKGRVLSESELQRVAQAAARISEARDHVHGR